MTSNISTYNIAAVIVLYNPDKSVRENIESYIGQVDKLYAVDNSEHKNDFLIEKLKQNEKIKYIDNKGNRGIAHALNVGAGEAMKDGYDFLLTMDQDSRFKSEEFNLFLKTVDQNDISIGMYAPLLYAKEDDSSPFFNLVCITSGSILNLEVYQKVGPFDDKLFIDSVDTEYCLRMRKKGFFLKRITSVVMDHHLGDIKEFKFLFWKLHVTNHSSLRRYYIIRNRLYTWNTFKNDFPEYIRFERGVAFKEMIKIIIGETNKLKKIKMSIIGYLDYRRNKFGKYEK